MFIFVGNKENPAFLLEYTPPRLVIFRPDRHSKPLEDPLEKYVLGKIKMECDIKNLVFHQGKHQKDAKYKYVCEVIVDTGNEYFLVCNDAIKKLYSS
jgi:hypothetical protein